MAHRWLAHPPNDMCISCRPSSRRLQEPSFLVALREPTVRADAAPPREASARSLQRVAGSTQAWETMRTRCMAGLTYSCGLRIDRPLQRGGTLQSAIPNPQSTGPS
jgi:hypothetical protein